jgi:hypothetical protein
LLASELCIKAERRVASEAGGSCERETDEEPESLLGKELAVLREGGTEVVSEMRRGQLDQSAIRIVKGTDDVSAELTHCGSDPW